MERVANGSSGTGPGNAAEASRVDPSPCHLPSPFSHVQSRAGEGTAGALSSQLLFQSISRGTPHCEVIPKQLGTRGCKRGCRKWIAVKNPDAELEGLTTHPFHRMFHAFVDQKMELVFIFKMILLVI